MNIAIVSNDYFAKNIENITDEIREMLAECVNDTIYSHTKDESSDTDSGVTATNIKLFKCKAGDNIMSQLENFKPDLLITENLAGFNMTTLMDSIAYNKIHALQIHVISDDPVLNSSDAEGQDLSILKGKPLSLSMHFVCKSDGAKELLLTANSDIPYIHVIPDLRIKNLAEAF
ncbi:hypothetical protein [Butyrivibrio proteoclasticus]|uniref:hypothetical protein n=1 Tax=Butyrivibrio proteoclasticus TaxID=43305 RepID=UPI00047BB456|nr:hypothetical protein [Butyrivibrio proteoclasticus]